MSAPNAFFLEVRIAYSPLAKDCPLRTLRPSRGKIINLENVSKASGEPEEEMRRVTYLVPGQPVLGVGNIMLYMLWSKAIKKYVSLKSTLHERLRKNEACHLQFAAGKKLAGTECTMASAWILALRARACIGKFFSNDRRLLSRMLMVA